MITANWSLIEFKNLFGKFYVHPFTSKSTGEVFLAPVCKHPTTGAITLLSYSKKLGQLTREQLNARHSELQVIQNDEGAYIVCSKNELLADSEACDF
jgi:hypothetical protein